MLLSETSKSFPKYTTIGRSTLVKIKSPGEEQEPTAHLKECITTLTNYPVDEAADRDLVGLRIRNTENVRYKLVVNSLRRRDQFKAGEVWHVLP